MYKYHTCVLLLLSINKTGIPFTLNICEMKFYTLAGESQILSAFVHFYGLSFFFLASPFELLSCQWGRSYFLLCASALLSSGESTGMKTGESGFILCFLLWAVCVLKHNRLMVETLCKHFRHCCFWLYINHSSCGCITPTPQHVCSNYPLLTLVFHNDRK